MSLILCISATREIYEDYKRFQADKVVNLSLTRALSAGDEARTCWKDVRVGQILCIHRNETLPADLVLLSSSEPAGYCYLETATIDGETNLKIRQARPETAAFNSPHRLARLHGCLLCQPPNNSIHVFEGSLQLAEAHAAGKMPLDHQQFLPRGSVLKNTAWVYGLAVYTGHETRIMQNSRSSRLKRTRMEVLTDRQSLFIVLGILSLTMAAALCNHYNAVHVFPKHTYLLFRLPDRFGPLIWYHLSTFISFLLLLNSLVPISLSITLESIRVILAQLIDSDCEMYDAQTDTPASTKASNLIEALGQVEYVLTDKTGTLTCNQMELHHVVVRGRPYRHCLQASSRLRQELDRGDGSDATDLLLKAMALCHTVMIDLGQAAGSLSYRASSPDELASVNAAARLDYALTERIGDAITLTVRGRKASFEVLAIIEFSSARKRMSVLCRELSTQRVFLFCKGADSVLHGRLQDPASADVAGTFRELEAFAEDGLRTLCYAYRELGADDAAAWLAHWQHASTAMHGRQTALAAAAEAIEQGLTLLGATGVEDRLQEGVPETIDALLLANIRVWMLTGDRMETAVNTAVLSGMLLKDHCVVTLQALSLPDVTQRLTDALTAPAADTAVVVDGHTLSMLIDPPSGGAHVQVAVQDRESQAHAHAQAQAQAQLHAHALHLFMELAAESKCVICCRLSPLQKSHLVHLVKERLQKVTLAIGDGGNDVSMIQTADVGIGISGLEGMQAARAADFSIARFRFLRRLLLVHGAWSLHRLSRTVLYAMYKNVTLYFAQVPFAVPSMFSAQSLLPGWMLMLYNVIFTALPPAMIGLTDQFVPADELLRCPQLYRFGQSGRFYNTRLFWGAIGNGLLHVAILFGCVHVLTVDGAFTFPGGAVIDLRGMGALYYALALLVVSLKVVLFTNFYTLLLYLSILLGIVAWFASYLVLGDAGETRLMLTAPAFWLALLLVPVLAVARDYLWRFYRRQFRPHPYHLAQERCALARRRAKARAKTGSKMPGAVKGLHARGFTFVQTPGQTELLHAYSVNKP